MDNFMLSDQHKGAAAKMLIDLGISERDVKDQISPYDEYGEDTVVELLELIAGAPASQPLFEHEEDALDLMRFAENVCVARIYVSRMSDEKGLSDRYRDIECGRLRLILTGYNVIRVLGERMFQVDCRDYDFITADEMFYVLGAHLSNIAEYNDSRIVNVDSMSRDGKKIVNSYYNDTNGDFRLFQYDVSTLQSANPVDEDEILPFAKRKQIGCIAGYHSVEASFLGGLLTYLFQENIHSEFLDNFEKYLSEIKSGGQSFGPYADAGQFSEGMARLSLFGIESGEIAPIHTDGKYFYHPEVVDGDLLYYLCAAGKEEKTLRFTLEPCMVDEIIKGLFKKVARGNGRSCVKELEGVIRAYFDMLNNELEENVDL